MSRLFLVAVLSVAAVSATGHVPPLRAVASVAARAVAPPKHGHPSGKLVDWQPAVWSGPSHATDFGGWA